MSVRIIRGSFPIRVLSLSNVVLSLSNVIDEHKHDEHKYAPFISCVGKGGDEHRVKEEGVAELKPARGVCC